MEKLPPIEKIYEAYSALADGREKNNANQKRTKETMKTRLARLIEADDEFGRRRTYAQYADDLGITERTVIRYMKELSGS